MENVSRGPLFLANQTRFLTTLFQMPTVGYTGLDYTSRNYMDPSAADYDLYARRHSGLMKFDSITDNPARLARHRNFNNFGEHPCGNWAVF